MPKFKQGFNGGSYKCRIEPEYMLSQYEMDIIGRRNLQKLLSVELGKNGMLIYSSPYHQTFRQKMAAGIDHGMLWQMVRQIVELVQELRSAGLSEQRVVFSPELIFWDDMSQNAKFIYYPVNGEPCAYDVILFLHDLVFSARLGGEQQSMWNRWLKALEQTGDYRGAYSRLANMNIKYASEKADQNLYIQKDTSKTENKGFSDGYVDDDEAETGFDEDYDDEAETGFDEDYDDEAQTGFDENYDDEAQTGFDEDYDDEAQTGFDEGYDDNYSYNGIPDDGEAMTGLCQEEMELTADGSNALDCADGTYLYDSKSEQGLPRRKYRSPRLIRRSTGEFMWIETASFSVGRSTQRANMCIPGNSRISNIHAIILKKGNTFYLKDNGSTNGTFLNGNKINPQMDPVRLRSGDRIRLYDEELEFIL